MACGYDATAHKVQVILSGCDRKDYLDFYEQLRYVPGTILLPEVV